MGCKPVCNCNFTMGNTGYGCIPLIHVTKKVMIIPYLDTTGAQNYIDVSGTTTLNNAYFVALINQADTSKRLFPLPELKNVEDKRSEPIVQKFNDESTIFIRNGIRNFKGIIPGKTGSPVLTGKIEAARCGDVGVYLVDRLGSIIGILSDDKTKLYPIRIDSESLSATYGAASDTTTQMIELSFNFHVDEQDSCIGMIQSTDYASDVTMLTYKGLLDVYVKYTSPSTTGAIAEFYTDFGTPMAKVRVTGLVVSDFVSSVGGATSKVRDTVGAVDLTLSTATEGTGTSAGIYTLVWTPAQATADKIVTLIKKTGYDAIGVVSTPVTVP